jgi:hypothetical protein
VVLLVLLMLQVLVVLVLKLEVLVVLVLQLQVLVVLVQDLWETAPPRGDILQEGCTGGRGANDDT